MNRSLELKGFNLDPTLFSADYRFTCAGKHYGKFRIHHTGG